MRYSEGEYMPLVWEGSIDEFYIRGHVSPETAIQILLEEEVHLTCHLDRNKGWVDEERILGEPRHAYGRWSCEATWDDAVTHILRTYKTAGRGRFKITCVPVTGKKTVLLPKGDNGKE